MNIEKIKKIISCGWALAHVEVNWLIEEVERLENRVKTLEILLNSENKTLARNESLELENQQLKEYNQELREIKRDVDRLKQIELVNRPMR